MVNEEKPELCPAKEEGKTKSLSEGEQPFQKKQIPKAVLEEEVCPS